MSKLEISFHTNQCILECGLDEVGAGALCGPVYAAAVIWPNELPEQVVNSPEYGLIRDSKQLSSNQRQRAIELIEYVAIDYAISSVDAPTIDRINILNARIQAMHQAIDKLCIKPELLLVDGTQFHQYYQPSTKQKIPFKLIDKGDQKYQSIAAASILAKVKRDQYIESLHKTYPNYGWNTNKGYGTRQHFEAIRDHGTTPLHRMSFNLAIRS